MGFPVGYTDLFFPKSLVQLLTVLGIVRKCICAVFSLIGLGDFLEPETASYGPRVGSGSEPRSVASELIREMLPVVRFSDLAVDGDLELPESCAVCLCEFGGENEIQRLANCQHICHWSYLDRWMDHDKKMCRLCPHNIQRRGIEKKCKSGKLDYKKCEGIGNLKFKEIGFEIGNRGFGKKIIDL